MNENLNLIEKLKNVPKGTKLWSPICGDCYFQRIIEGSSYPIFCTAMLVNGNYSTIYFTEEGLHFNKFTDGGCALFPSKTNYDWSTFVVPKKHKEFKPGQQVLIFPNSIKPIWRLCLYSHWNQELETHVTITGNTYDDDKILPYKGNENLLGEEVQLYDE